jgi:hypothetical protein
MVNFTDASCLNFGKEHNLFLKKVGRALPWFVNAFQGYLLHTLGVQVTTLPEMARDMQQMRLSIDRMSGIVSRGGEQLERMNPMGVIQQMVPGATR